MPIITNDINGSKRARDAAAEAMRCRTLKLFKTLQRRYEEEQRRTSLLADYQRYTQTCAYRRVRQALNADDLLYLRQALTEVSWLR